MRISLLFLFSYSTDSSHSVKMFLWVDTRAGGGRHEAHKGFILVMRGEGHFGVIRVSRGTYYNSDWRQPPSPLAPLLGVKVGQQPHSPPSAYHLS